MCLKSGEFWQAHEEWEQIWARLPRSPLRCYLQAMIQVAAACYKPQQVRMKQCPVQGMQRGMGALLETAVNHLDAADGLRSAFAPVAGFEASDILDAVNQLRELQNTWVEEGLELGEVEQGVEAIATQLAERLEGGSLLRDSTL